MKVNPQIANCQNDPELCAPPECLWGLQPVIGEDLPREMVFKFCFLQFRFLVGDLSLPLPNCVMYRK